MQAYSDPSVVFEPQQLRAIADPSPRCATHSFCTCKRLTDDPKGAHILSSAFKYGLSVSNTVALVPDPARLTTCHHCGGKPLLLRKCGFPRTCALYAKCGVHHRVNKLLGSRNQRCDNRKPARHAFSASPVAVRLDNRPGVPRRSNVRRKT